MLILSNVARLYDGTSGETSALHEGVDVHIDGERIAEVRPHQPDLAVGSGHTSVDCSGLTVTPGLVDCHGHITVLGLDPASMETMLGPQELTWVERALHTTLVDGGVTTYRDIGGATHAMKRMVDDGTLIGPRLKIAICMLSTTGGHADFRGPDRCHASLSKLWPDSPGRPSSIVDGPWEARTRVREIAACGADLIKLCTSPGVASPGDKLEHRDFTAEEIAAICDEAAARGLNVAAHAHSQTGIEMAIDNGVHDIQHVSYMDERLVEKAHAKGCVVTPTSWVVQALPHAEGLSDFVMEKVKQVAEVHANATAHAVGGGLPVLAGTDPVLPGMHGRNWREIQALVTEGMSVLGAFHAMTGLGAEHIGQPDAGTLVAGQRADLLVCKEDVTADPAAFERGAILEVIKDGTGYRGGLDGVPQRTWSGRARETLNPSGGTP
jgi:imidazolonepropionase-like amidohydrolase